ncbi:MAG: hypothetical protein GXX79_06805 [Actinomycetales bacterium]|nr:hypothetical protein [Actinomycetales bacterium]
MLAPPTPRRVLLLPRRVITPAAGRALGRRLRAGLDAALSVALSPLELDFSDLDLGNLQDETWM